MSGWSLKFAPFLPPPALALLALAGLALLALMIWHRRRGWGLRALTLALLFAALLNPGLRQEERQPIPDIVVAVVDDSQSQQAGLRPAQSKAALAALTSQVKALGNTELRTITVRSGPDAAQSGTRLIAGLERVLADIPPERFAGAVFITDGAVHDVPGDVKPLAAHGPLHTILTGSRAEIDRRVVVDEAPRFAITGKEQHLRFHVDDGAGAASQPVTVTLRRDGGTPETLTVAPGQSVDHAFTLDHAGETIIEIEAPPLAHELTTANNRAILAVQGVRDRLKVLLVSGQPHAGERVWRSLLKSDTAVDLIHFTILRSSDGLDPTPSSELALIPFPTGELFGDKLKDFDLVIFDRYRMRDVLPDLYLMNVADYVKQGGTLLVASGPEVETPESLYNSPLADVLATAATGSVTEEAFRPGLTAAGQRHPVTQGLPGSESDPPAWGRWFRSVDVAPAAPGAQVLMHGLGDRPLLVLSRHGKGRVAELLSDHGWLWSRGYDGGGPQMELLRRLAHWLMQEPDLEEEKLSARQQGRNLVIERRTMADTAADVTVTLPSGKTETVKLAPAGPGRFTAVLAVSESGMARLSDGTLTAAAGLGSGDTREAMDLRATAALMKPLVDASGGGLFWLEDGMPRALTQAKGRPMAGPHWLGLRANGLTRTLSVKELPLVSTLLALAVLLLALAALWQREGR